MTENLSFESLPNAVASLSNQVQELRNLILEQEGNSHKNRDGEFLTIQEASELLNLAKATIYSKVSRGELPSMKRGKKLYFSKAELISFIKGGRKQTKEQREANAANLLTGTKKGLNNE